MKQKHHFLNMYLTAGISVALVLLLIGLECVLVLSARGLIRQVKENVALTVIIKNDSDTAEVSRLSNLLSIAPFCREYKYISKEDALQEHINALGEDPTKFLGYNPIEASFEVKLHEKYTQLDSIHVIENKLSAFQSVKNVLYQEDVLSLLDKNLSKISILILGIALILLIVACALIVNTIQLHVYSKRFLINTMKLVGAKPWTIKGPIVGRNVIMGIVAAIIALLLLYCVLYYCQHQLAIRFIQMNVQNMLIVSLSVLVCGILITFLASVFATNRYIRMNTNKLYYL